MTEDMAESVAESVPNKDVTIRATLKSSAEDVFRGLWASLFYSGRMGGKSVLICSANPGEGASTIACGLALSGTSAGGVSRVALVDFNLRNPSMHRILGASQSPGIGEILVEGLGAESAAQRVNASLDVYTAGKVDGRTLDVLRSDALAGFLSNLNEGYDHVLIDVAPANPFPDAQVLASTVKDVVLVVETDRSPREAVAQAKKRLEAAGARLVGLVMNLRTYPIPKFLYRRV